MLWGMTPSWVADDSDLISHHSSQHLRPFSAPGGADRSPPIRQSQRLSLSFSVRRLRDRLDFAFVLAGGRPGDTSRIVLPELRDPADRSRRNDLWKATCLEVFVGPASGTSYVEMNLSPCGHWNLYAFDDYRAGMREVGDASPPLSLFERSTDGSTLRWAGSLISGDGAGAGEVKELLAGRSLVMSATAVLEYATGEREYWALVHAGAKPDFHLRESFRLVL